MAPTKDQLERFFKAANASYKEIKPKRDPQTLKFAFGMEFRLNLKAAFEAAALAATAGISLKRAIQGQADGADVFSATAAYLIWPTLLNAVRRKMKALEYVVCLTLMENPEGLEEDEVLPKAKQFALDSLKKKPKGSWLAGSEDTFKDALIQIKEDPTPKDYLKSMQDAGWIVKKKGKFVVKQCHFTFGLKGE